MKERQAGRNFLKLIRLEGKKVLADRRFLGIWVFLLILQMFLAAWQELPSNEYTPAPAEYEALYGALQTLTPQEAADELKRRIEEIEAAQWAEILGMMEPELEEEGGQDEEEEEEAGEKEEPEIPEEDRARIHRAGLAIDRVLPDHPYAAERLIRQVYAEVSVVAGRDDMIATTVRRAEQMPGLSLFQESLSEAELGNLRKTGADFSGAVSIPVERVTAERGLSLMFQSPETDMFVFLLLFLGMHLMVASGYGNGMETVVLSSRKGRGPATAARVAALFLVTGLVWAGFFVTRAAVCLGLYSWGDLSRPVQTVSSYVKCLFSLSAGGLLAVHFLWKWVWYFLFIVLQMAVMKGSRKEFLADGLILGCWGLGLFLWNGIAENSVYRIWRYINVYYLLRPDQIWAGYNNIRVGNGWVSGWLFAGAATVLLLAGCLWALWLLRRRILQRKPTRSIARRRRSGPTFLGLLSAEYRKAFVVLRIGLVFLALFALQWDRSREDVIRLGSDDMILRSYQVRWERELTRSDEELEELIREEEKELSRARKDESEIYSRQMAESLANGFAEASWRYREAVQTARKREEPVLYFFDKAYDRLVNDPLRDIRHGAEASLLIVLLMACLAGQEHAAGMRRMLKTTSRGEAQYYRNKILVLSTFVILTMILVYGPDVRLVGKTYGFETAAASVGSLSCLPDFPLPVSVGGYLAILYGWRFLVLMLIGIGVLLVTEGMKNTLLSALVCLILVWLPYLLYYLGAEWAAAWGVVPFLSGNGWFQSWGAG